MYEMWMRKQTHEDAKKRHRTTILVRTFWKNAEGVLWEVMTWSEEWTDKEKT